ncbi:MAG: M56 family metallopeptidase [Pedobacter sp.]
MNALSYLIQVNVYLLLFYGLYLLMLRNETFFKMNRMYLVGSTLLALVIPIMKAQWINDLFVSEQIYEATRKVNTALTDVVFSAPIIPEQSDISSSNVSSHTIDVTAAQFLWTIYVGVTVLFLLNFLRKLYLVNRVLKSPTKFQAFSFFNKVVVDVDLKGREIILDHEMVHVKQWHSIDIIFFELLAAFNWFNPISFRYKKEIRDIHEFIADEAAATKMNDKAEYGLLLVSNAFGINAQKLTNSFYNDSLLKRRLIMLNKNKSRKVAILKYGLAAPLFAIMIIFSSASIEKSKTISAVASSIERSLPVLVSALKSDRLLIKNVAKLPKANKRQLTINDTLLLYKRLDSVSLPVVNRFFSRSIKYPAADQEAGKVGTTYLTFELDDAGVMHNPSVVQAMSDMSRSEVWRVLENVEPFGEGIMGKYILPIKYILDLDKAGLKSKSSNRFNQSKYKGYQQLDEVIIRGYTKTTRFIEEPIDRVRKHFANTIKYPSKTPKDIMSGRTYLAFELDDDGKLNSPQIIKTVGTPFEKEIKSAIESAPPFGPGVKGKYVVCLSFIYGIQNSDLSTYNKENFKDFKFLKGIMFMGYFVDDDPETLLTRGEYNYTITGRSETIKSYPVLEQAQERYRIH